MIENLAPSDPPYPFGTKRSSLEQSFYEVFNQDNVSVVPFLKNPMAKVLPDGVELQDGTEIDLEALILATGFDAITGSFTRLNIEGLEGRSLSTEWKKGTRACMGICTSGFPNMFFLYGPQSPTASAAGPVTLDIQADWVLRTMVHMRKHSLTRIDAKPEAEQEWVRHTNEECDKTLLHLNTTTWYVCGNIPGKKREALHYLGGLPLYNEALESCAKAGWSSFHTC